MIYLRPTSVVERFQIYSMNKPIFIYYCKGMIIFHHYYAGQQGIYR